MQAVVVTGAAGGMGQALCELLVSEGRTVLGVDHNHERLAKLSHSLGNALIPLALDLGQSSMAAIVRNSISKIGALQGLVNLAGISLGNSIELLTDDDWERSFQVNVTAAMRLTRECIPFLIESGRGSVVNVASPVSLIGARKPSYSASKAALMGLTMSLARSLGRKKIRVNCLLPGTTMTFLTQDWSEEKRQRIAEKNFLGRLCQPIEIARGISFLLSDNASFITGTTLDMTAGGMFQD